MTSTGFSLTALFALAIAAQSGARANDIVAPPLDSTQSVETPTRWESESSPAPMPQVDSASPTQSSSAAIQAVETVANTVLPLNVKDIVSPSGNTLDLTRSTADLWDRVRNGFAIPNLEGRHVASRQTWLAERPDQIRIMVERGRRYMFHIVEELEKRGMPTELALLPMVESAMNPMAYSSARASGLWQFIPSTGKQYKLEQDWWFDARRDIVASTKSALDYLQFLYDMHGDWHLALASYNWGENAVARAIERNKQAGLPTDYQSLSMPQETRYYVPKLQALKNIIDNPAAHGVDLQRIPNLPYFVTVELTRDIDLKLAARLAEMPVEELVALNPGHNRPVVSARKSGSLVVPTDRLDAFVRNVASYDKPMTRWRTYAAQRGERVDRIAAAHGMALEAFRQVNGIQGSGRLRSDTQLIVPSGAGAELVPGMFRGPAMIAAEPDTVARRYVVRKGDNWNTLAARFKVPVADLKAWNNGTALASGQRVTVHVTASSGGAAHKVSAKAVKRLAANRIQVAKR